jgi:lysophospholipase L1-like esterase
MPGTAREFPKMNKRIKSRKFKVLIICILFFAVSFSALEILARVRLNKIRGGYPAGMYAPDSELGFRYRANFTGGFPGIYRNITIRTNSEGFRDYEHSGNSSAKKILAVGDSVAFGPGVMQEDSYPAQIEAILRLSGKNVEVLNRGVDSYDFSQEKILSEREASVHSPSAILVGFVLNDIAPFNRESAAGEKLGMPLCASCRIAGLLLHPNYNEAYFSGIYKAWNEADWNRTRDEIKALSEFCRANNITLAFAVFPYQEQFNSSLEEPFLPQQLLEDELSKDGIPYVDLRDVLENCSSCYLTGDSVHLNERGSRAIAEKISSFLEENNLI